MDNLISREAACECIGKIIHEYREKGEDDLADGMILARRYGIKRLPAVDAVTVVRCRDCKWFDCKNYVCNNDTLAGRIADCGCYPNFNVEPDWFCADGERRDSE